MGWDGIDAFRANAHGWHTGTLTDLAFYHHRAEGERDGRWNSWWARGRAAHYMGYRPSFVVFRTAHRLRSDRATIAMAGGWLQATLRREPRCDDILALTVLRRQQRFRALPLRAREALGRRTGS